MQTKTRKAVVAHKIIETGESLLNILGRADARRAASLEIIAVLAVGGACHYLETIGLDWLQFGKHLNARYQIQ